MMEPEQIFELPEHPVPDLSRLEQELRDLGWQSMALQDPDSGMTFNRWFPPGKPTQADYAVLVDRPEGEL